MKITDERHPLQARARKLGAWIGPNPYSRKEDKELYGGPYGSYALFCSDRYHLIWDSGLPVEGIIDALGCLECEHVLDPEADIAEAWADFGKSWMK